MTTQFRAQQTWAIAKIEMRRAFFSKRAFWVYFLALFPAVIFIGHALDTKFRERHISQYSKVQPEVMNRFAEGMTQKEVLALAGKPAQEHEHHFRRRVEKNDEDEKRRTIEFIDVEGSRYTYFDARRRADVWFEDGKVTGVNVRAVKDFDEDKRVYAAVFQYFYLRLAIFFGCLGIFMNLFRGEMLDKTLHFWFLAPVRREVLLTGKYLAGLVASSVIFAGGAMLSFGAMLWSYTGPELDGFLQTVGWNHAFWYASAAVLGCVGYGSVFVAAGLLLRNPIIPAAVLLIWESINGFLPDMLQKLSVLHYLQSICPVPAPTDPGMPELLKLLLSPAAPSSKGLAVLGLAALTLLVLWAASKAVRRLEINYSTE